MLGIAKRALRASMPQIGKWLDRIDQLEAETTRLRQELDFLRGQCFVPPGHFYSPVTNRDEILSRQSDIFAQPARTISGIDLRESAQLELLESLLPFYGDLPFQDKANGKVRFCFENPAYSYSDAVLLYCMLRYLRPANVIEIGCGYSSLCMLETSKLFLDDSVRFEFIEPYPALLKSLLSADELSRVVIHEKPLQEVPLTTFEKLASGDILFIDSTHISKTGSDVNREFFDILPVLNPGVLVHIHDIFYPFEYPREWVLEGRSWNEAYLLRAFLQFNIEFEIVLFNTFLAEFHSQVLAEKMPLCGKGKGASIWLRRKST